jgi:hypothetical protein
MGVKPGLDMTGGTYTVVFENRARRRIFGPRRDEVTSGRRKLHYELLCNL